MGSGEPEVKPSGEVDVLGGLGGLDFGSGPTTTQPSSGFMPPPSSSQPATTDLLGDMLGGSSAPVAQPAAAPSSDFNNPFGGDDMFGGQADEGAGDDWAGGFGETSSSYDLTYVKSSLVEVMPATQQGKKKQASGIAVSAAVNYHQDKNQLILELEFRNESGGPVTDFNLMINKNSFGVGPDAPVTKHGITYPAPFESSPVQYLPLRIDKNNADPKKPPKHPFQLELAMNSSLDVFYFSVGCELHHLINYTATLSQDDFNKFWGMCGPDKTFNFTLSAQE